MPVSSTSHTLVKDLMTPNPQCIDAQSSLKEAARMMADLDCGVLPVGSEENPEGIITDRDIVIRAVAEGKDINTTTVAECMTQGVCCCNADDPIQDAGRKMRENHVNRLLVKDKEGKVCGILTFGRIVREEDSASEISEVIECAVGRKAA